MNVLHVGTCALTLGIACLAIGAAFFGLHAVRDGRSAGSNWSLAAICQGLAWILDSMAGELPIAFSIVLPKVLMVANAVLLLRGAVRYDPAPPPFMLKPWPWAVFLLLTALPFAWFSYADDNLPARLLLASLIRIPLLVAAFVFLSRQAPRNGRAVLCTLFGIGIVWHVLQALAGVSDHAPLRDLLQTDAIQVTTLMLGGASIILVIATQFRIESDNARDSLRAWAEALEVESLQLEKTIEQRNQELHAMATTDCMTGLANRRQFLASAAQEIERAHRYGHKMSLLMIDIDHFKSINDQFGHPTGDLAIIAIGRHCGTACRGSDLAGRLGGEEFALLLPETGMEEAQAVAERLRAGAQTLQVMHEGRNVPLRLSIGIACLDAGDAGPDTLLARADRALYAAKNGGRDCVRYA
ncbi:diguanylate cyclase [Pseudoduganella eburnea]|uniref:diguanylate cyclase n=1 Tax=Massilia eburnea TaxID=1776165 RepID=A0A6L6QAS2_9BURK|nr:GGDEF domain-containing protein [Massilia eburnea]MTW09164.1 diguanylate cyclase [Massilia eburnea]